MRIDIDGNVLDSKPSQIVSSYDFWLDVGTNSSPDAILFIENEEFVITKEEAKEMSAMLLKGLELGFFDGLEAVE